MADYRASWLRGQHVAGLLGSAGTGESPDERRLRDELREQLVAHGDDPVFWQSFWDTATPEDLYLVLGPAYLNNATPLKVELRAALGAGTAAWAASATQDERQAFGAAVVEGITRSGVDVRSEIAGDLLPPGLPAAVYDGAYDALVAPGSTFLEKDTLGRVAMEPLAVAVAAGLARYPHLAFEKLAPVDNVRTAHLSRAWFGSGPRSGWPDGGTAIASAFRAAVREGSDSPDRHEQERAAMLVAHATRDMPDGLLSGHVSAEASAEIARAYEPYVPSFGEAVDRPGQEPGTTDAITLAETTERPRTQIQPELDAFALREVIAATSRSAEGADAWLSGADVLRDDVIDRATSGRYDTDTVTRNDLGQQYAKDVGVIAGSMQAETISTARQRMEEREHLIDVAGLATIKAKPVVSLTAGAVTTALPQVLPDHVANARAEVLATEPELRRQLVEPIHQAVVDHELAQSPAPRETWSYSHRREATEIAHDHAEFQAAQLHPDAGAVGAMFRETYNEMSDLQPRLEDKLETDR
jgi:hypothetical protein